MMKALSLILVLAASVTFQGCSGRNVGFDPRTGKITTFKSDRFGVKENIGRLKVTNGKNPSIEIEAMESDLVQGLKVVVQTAIETALKAGGIPTRGVPENLRTEPVPIESSEAEPLDEIEP